MNLVIKVSGESGPHFLPPPLLDHCTDAVASEGAGLKSSLCVECAVCVLCARSLSGTESRDVNHAVTYQKAMPHK